MPAARRSIASYKERRMSPPLAHFCLRFPPLLSCSPSTGHRLSLAFTPLCCSSAVLRHAPLPQYRRPQATSFLWASLTSSLGQGLCVPGSCSQEHAFLSICMPDSFLFLAISSVCNFLSRARHFILCRSVLFTALTTI